MSAAVRRLNLFAHPGSEGSAVHAIEAGIGLAPNGSYRLSYRVFGEAGKVRIPPQSAPERASDLWRHTCFECFVAGPGADYREFNFSPSTQWAAYRFDSYRQGMREQALASPPRIHFTATSASIILDAVVDLTGVLCADARVIRIGLAAVIEELDGAVSYWALAHTGEKPDFHRQDGFIAGLPDNVD